MIDRFVVVGNPESRRVTLFCAALARLGLPPATVLSHRDLLADPTRLNRLDPGPAHVRIESVGQDDEVAAALLARGQRAAGGGSPDLRSPTPPAHYGQLSSPRLHHRGFLSYLDDLAAVFAERPNWTVWSPPASVADLFDKDVTGARYAAAGVPVPEWIDGVQSPADLRDAMVHRGWKSVVVKLTCGSSASGLAVFSGARLMTTMRWEGDAWTNSRRLQRVSAPTAVGRVLAYLIAEGARVERFVPKARLDHAYFDCRVLMVAGEPAFVVVRQNSHPITNLHLGGRRGSLENLRAAVPPASWAAAMESCRRVWASHDCHHVGVDLMFEPGLQAHRVLEANAFGDLLPGLERDGHDVYAWEIAHRPQ